MFQVLSLSIISYALSTAVLEPTMVSESVSGMANSVAVVVDSVENTAVTEAPAEQAPAEQAPAPAPAAEAPKPAEPAPAPAAEAPKPAEPAPAPAAEAPKPAEPASAPAAAPVPAPAPAAEVKPAEAPKPVEKPKYETVELKAKRMTVAEDFTAVLVPREVVPMSLELNEWSSSFRVLSAKEHGARVEKGEQVVELDLEAYDRTLVDLRREQRMMEITLLRAKAAIESQRALLELNKKELEQGIERSKDNFNYFWTTEWPAKLKATQLQFKLDQMGLQAAEEELNQLEKMYKADDLIEDNEEFLLKRQRMSVAVARFNFERTKETYARTTAVMQPRTVEDNKQRYERLEVTWKENLITAPTAIKTAELEFETQQITMDRLNQRLKRLEEQRELLNCKAPVSGRFFYGSFDNNKYSGFDTSTTTLKRNGTLALKKEFAVIIPDGPEYLSLTIPEKFWSDAQSGMKGWFTATAYGRVEIPVVMKSITSMPIADAEFQGTAEFATDLPAGVKLLPGMKGKARFVLAERKKAIFVPEGAVARDEASTQRYVYVVNEDGDAVRRNVQLGYLQNSEYEITDGLESGENVVKDWKKVEE